MGKSHSTVSRPETFVKNQPASSSASSWFSSAATSSDCVSRDLQIRMVEIMREVGVTFARNDLPDSSKHKETET